MISKLSVTDDLSIRQWAQDVRDSFNTYIQCLEIPVSKSGIGTNYVKGKHPAKNLVALDKAYFCFIVPNSLAQFRDVRIRFIPNTTGSINYTVNLSYGHVGQAHNATTKTVSVTSKAVTDSLISELDISTLFIHPTGDQETNDQIGVEFVLDALTTTTSIDVLSLYIKYI